MNNMGSHNKRELYKFHVYIYNIYYISMMYWYVYIHLQIQCINIYYCIP